jgi:hypothetical protein
VGGEGEGRELQAARSGRGIRQGRGGGDEKRRGCEKNRESSTVDNCSYTVDGGYQCLKKIVVLLNSIILIIFVQRT